MTKTTGTTPEAEAKDAALPGNHGQFGANNATEDYAPLQDMPAVPVDPVAPEPGPGPAAVTKPSPNPPH